VDYCCSSIIVSLAKEKNQMELNFGPAIILREHFCMPVDESDWINYDYSADFSPIRDRATFKTTTGGMIPLTREGQALRQTYGVYILVFSIPSPAYYVGVAANEPVLGRIRRHRVKVTGSHIGANENSNGGVRHSRGWQNYAIQRAKHFAHNGVGHIGDNCDDAKLLIGTLTEDDQNFTDEEFKQALEYFEHKIVENTRGMTAAILKILLPDHDFRNILSLNSHPRLIEGTHYVSFNMAQFNCG
jgi:hypothetical protein